MARRLASDVSEGVSLRTIAWVEAVMRVSGKPLSQLEKEFNPPSKDNRFPTRSCLWQKYRQGTVVPRSGGKGKGRDLVAEVDLSYPDTAKVFHATLWLLCGNQPVELHVLKQIYNELRPDLKSLFVRNADSRFWRRLYDNIGLCDELVTTPGQDALVALVGLLREAEIIQNRELYIAAADALLRRLQVAQIDANLLGVKANEVLASRIRHWQQACCD